MNVFHASQPDAAGPAARDAASARAWRSLEELADSEAFRQQLAHRWPLWSEQLDDPRGRRRFLQLMGASLALAGVTGCVAQPTEKIVPYVHGPEQIVPGRPLFFATAFPLAGFGQGVLVESHTGRPTKIEGNPQHSASLGATTALGQASILELYDPDRSQVVFGQGSISDWDAFYAALEPALRRQLEAQGAGLRILSEPVSSPTLLEQLDDFQQRFPLAGWHVIDSGITENILAATQLAFNEQVLPIYRLESADVIVGLEADFLCSGPACLHNAHRFAQRRRSYEPGASLSRYYSIESIPTTSGASADHRLVVGPDELRAIARSLASKVGVRGIDSATLPPAKSRWVEEIAKDLAGHRSRCVAIAGDEQPPEVQALAHAMNDALGAIGTTVDYTAGQLTDNTIRPRTFESLIEEMSGGDVELLIILSGNPVYTSPVDLQFSAALEKVPLCVHLGLYRDETGRASDWHIPAAHYLESWSDARAFDGTITILQPLIAPLYEGKTAHELMSTLAMQPGRTSYDIVREAWQKRFGSGEFERKWQTALHDGVVAGTAWSTAAPRLRADFAAQLSKLSPPSDTPRDEGLDLLIRLDSSVHDGRFANLGWLQELPRPLTKLTWDNAVLISPATAKRLGLANEDLVELSCSGHSVEGPVWIVPGQADDCVQVHLGYGRTHAGHVGTGVGFNAYTLRTSKNPWQARGAKIAKLHGRRGLACTQSHHTMEGRPLARSANLAEYRAQPDFAQRMEPAPTSEETLYSAWKYDGHAWGMTVDLNSCIGCNACVIACQAENNIPVVGRDEVLRGREMHWIRIDRYYTGEPDAPDVALQPVLCMHCEHAPCEAVCPVEATVHSAEGLNDMVYNRCVGTRYCSNNCPYKVRRFNFFQFADWTTPSLQLQRNPNVSVRSRGVMEKCTYCVQRINAARIEAEVDRRPLRDGDIVTACQAACPTRALVFGDVNDPSSTVSQLK